MFLAASCYYNQDFYHCYMNLNLVEIALDRQKDYKAIFVGIIRATQYFVSAENIVGEEKLIIAFIMKRTFSKKER